MNTLPTDILTQTYNKLSAFASLENFWDIFNTAFGKEYNRRAAGSLRSQWLSNDFSQFPQIEIIDSSILGSANGAYGISTNKIYLSDSFVANATPTAISAVLLEEIGHFVDAVVNQTDSAGDEGAIFAALIQGQSLDAATLQELKAEDDSGIIKVNGDAIAVENAVTPIASTGLNALLNETGKIYLSVDGSGTDSSSGVVQVLKNPGATVRKAYLIGDGVSSSGVGTSASVNGTTITWDRIESTPWAGGDFYSYLSDVTSLVKSTIDAAAAGTLNISVDEGFQSLSYEGLALAVVFDDPNQTVDQSVILYFGGLSPTGGTSTINFSSPVNTNSTLAATLGLGIGFSYNDFSITQTSQVKVNGQLLTSVAGNYDDGQAANGKLFTIGGLGDSPNNPSPSSTDVTTDDELYNLLPFINNGDTSLTLNTVNPSNDDHIFFAHLTLQGISGTDSTNVVTLAIAPASVNEDGTANLVYTFTRSGATSNALTVSYTVGGTATFNTDYTQIGAPSFTATTGTITFAAGVSTATLTIDPKADTTIETNETVALTLAAGTGYAVGTSTAVTGTITNDDPKITLAVAPASVNEDGTTNLVYTFTRTGATASALTVSYTVGGTATFNSDYTQAGAASFTATTGTVTFAAGSSTASVTINPTTDTTVESNETVALTLAAGTGYTIATTSAVTGTIVNDDITLFPGSLSFSAPQFSVNEDGTPIAAVTVTRTEGNDGAISAKINLNDGTAKAPIDYNNTAITVNLAAGEISKTVNIPIVNDTTPELDETLQLTLTTPTGGATIGQQNSASLTIIDNDAGLLITGLPQGASGSNKGQTTIVISGQNFLPTDQISLIAPNGAEKVASKVYWVNETEAWATFDLQGLTTGNYDVKVNNGQNSSVSNDSLTVTDGLLGNVQVQLSYPAQGFVTVNYTNVGETDVTAPLFRILPTNAQVTYPEENTVSATLRQLLNLSVGTSDNGATGILAPGESGKFSFAYTPNGNGLISFDVEQVNPSEVINWASIKAESRADYSFIDAAGWDAIWSNLTAAVGTTAAQFQAVMTENANYLSQLGQPTNDLTRLFAFEWKQAVNTLTNVDLLSTTDVVDAAPGLSLTFNRTFHQSIAERYNLGTLGRGWSSQWDLRATTDSQGDVVIRSVGDLQRLFEKQTDGTYLEDGGATLTIVSGQYRLKEINGLVSLFGTDGKLSYVEETNGNRITLQYTNNLLTKLVHTNGDSLTLAYNAQGRISQITDSTAQFTSYSYDATGERLLSVTTTDGTTTYTYDTGSVAAKKYSLLSVTSDLGYQRTFEYDNQGRLTKEFSNGQTEALTYSYDNTGGVTITDSTGASQTILLDDRGNGGQIRGVNNQNLLFSYDADGNLTSATLPNGSQPSYSYDANGNLTTQTNLLGQDVTFTYDATFNQLTGFTDPKGNGVSYSYDTKGNLNKITYPDGSFQQLSVDALGNITSAVNRRGNTIQYTYSTSGLLTKKQFTDGSNVSYSYDTKGNLTSVTDATGMITMQYDTANQLTKITYPTGRSLTYTYNADGQRTKLVSQDGYTVNYGYDTVGRLKTLTNATGQSIISYDYDNAGRLTKETNGNGTYTTYEYDQQSQLIRLSNYKADNTVNSKFEYAYDNLGRRTSMTTLEGTFQYGYDATGQLTSVVTPTNRTINYQYDAAGNRLGVTDSGATTDYTTNDLNQYINFGNAGYTYDKDGNLIGKIEGGQTSTYTYDVENRLVKVVSPQGTWEYQYDGLGNRVATVLNGQRTEYLLDPTGLGDIVGEYNGSTLVANYTHGIGLVSRVNGSNSNYYDADAIGSTIGLTASDGSYVNRYSYLPFGEDLTKVEGVANPFEYVGQWGVMDEGNGLDFMRARFYDTGLGRFTSVDPIGLNGEDTNFYRYVENNPVSFADPEGLWISVAVRIGSAALKLAQPLGRNITKAAKELNRNKDTLSKNEKIAEEIARKAGGGKKPIHHDPHQPGQRPHFHPADPKNPAKQDPNKGHSFYNIFPFIPLLPKPPEDPTPPNTPTPGGGTYNDPHLQTLDGLGYDFQTVGEFTLVKSTTDDFEIQTRQQPWGGSTSASANTAIAIKSGDQRIAIYANQTNPVIINGTAVTIPEGGLYAVGQNLIIRQGSQYSIITPNNDLILVSNRGTWLNINLGLADDRQGKVIGLLGNNNGSTNDDFALRNGTVIGSAISNQQLYGDYANSWRITQPTSLFDYAAGTSTATFTDLSFPSNIITSATLTPEQRAAAEEIARNAGITDPDVLEDVILDIFISNGNTDLIQGAIDQQRIETVTAPNTLINPDGTGTQHWLSANAIIPYTIRFSNNAAQGTTPVAQVSITQQLDSDLDLNTFTLNDFGFGDITVDVPTGLQNYSQRLDLRTTKGVFVDVNAGLNASTGVVTWTFTAIDPTTGNPANSTTQGFLPPNDQNDAGQGFVGYTIQPKANSITSARIDAQANITFNSQTPIQTTPVFNTLDGDAPTSKVNALSANSNPNFTVSWAGSDTGSGIAAYDIFVSTDGGQYTLWKDDITGISATYTGQAGHAYGFYSVATDNLGLTEIAPTQADTVTTVGTTQAGVIAFSAISYSINENGTATTPIALTRTNGSVGAVSVTLTPINGTATSPSDYNNSPIVVNFADGETIKTVNIPIANDTVYEANETIKLTLSNPTGGATLGTTKNATLTITDNDTQPVISLSANQSILEGLTTPQNVSYTVSLSNPSSQIITVNYATANGTAQAGSDYTNTTGTLTFSPGVTSQIINIPILNDAVNETDEVFTLTLTNPTNATLASTVVVTTTISDTLSASTTTTLPENLENLALTGTAAINGTGNAGNNVLTGNNANNTLSGQAGNDTLDGGGGVDKLIGGLGDDNYIVDTTTDTITELANQGIDTIQSSVTYSIAPFVNIENLTLTGIDAIAATGNSGNNVFIGNSGNNTLTGDSGSDQLNGGLGIDTLIGGLGDDAYIVDTTTDTINEIASQGTDTVQSSVTFSIANLGNIENLTLTGNSAIAGTGNSGNNVLTGNAGNNTLDGNTGVDTLIGGLGNDIYVVDTTTDTITEQNNEGTDAVKSSVSYNLATMANVENLTLTGNSPLNATGSTGNNVLIGNSGNNTLNGDVGNDNLNGGAGVDTLIGGLGNDIYVVDTTTDTITEQNNEGTDTVQSSVTFSIASLTNIENLTLTGTTANNGTGNTGNNVLIGNSSNNTLNGNTGNDTLNGGAGVDALIGGLGDDTYAVDTTTDTINEISGQGTDTVKSSVTYSIATLTNVENLSLTGIEAINGTGNAGNNVITGNSANNTINGGAGVDTLIGGLGDDTYIVDSTTDIITEPANQGIDIVRSSANFSIATLTNLENLTLTGTTATNATGNAGNNVLTGNSASNTLTGNAGNDTLTGATGIDTLIGGFGDDTYIVDTTTDTITEAANQGLDTVQSNVTYSLANLTDTENITLTGTTAINGTGNAGNNVLTGNSTNNTLTGDAGNDTLTGNAGVDTLIGGLGDDVYVVDSTTDTITEVATQGADTVQSRVTYSLGTMADVENLTLTGTAAINGTGNTGNNVITGNSANNTLKSDAGDDTLSGDAGNDILYAETGNDWLIGGLGNDILDGGADTDTFAWDATALNSSDVVAGGVDTLLNPAGDRLNFTSNVENLLNIGGLSLASLTADTTLTNTATSNISFGTGNSVRFVNSILQLDLDGNGSFSAASDFQIKLNGVNSLIYNAAVDYFIAI
ncbi:MAG TPA: Calx-beta domain-containing protein [Oculatellaceae cyanobacterium]|jgi:RHS repeat-associated protein